MGLWQYINWKIKQMPKERAMKMRHRLSLVYLFSAWNAFAVIVYLIAKFNYPENAEEEKYPTKYYAKLMNTDDAKVYKFSGFNFTHQYDIKSTKPPEPGRTWMEREAEEKKRKTEERERFDREEKDRQDLNLLVEETNSL